MAKETNKTNNGIEPSAEIELSEAEKVKKEIEELLNSAKEVASGIIEDAKAQAEKIRANASAVISNSSEEVKASIARGEELVEVELFSDTGKYSDDVYVSVNGENCIIKRGEPVLIKRKFKEVLDNSMAQDSKSAKARKNLAAEFERKTKELG